MALIPTQAKSMTHFNLISRLRVYMTVCQPWSFVVTFRGDWLTKYSTGQKQNLRLPIATKNKKQPGLIAMYDCTYQFCEAHPENVCDLWGWLWELWQKLINPIVLNFFKVLSWTEGGDPKSWFLQIEERFWCKSSLWKIDWLHRITRYDVQECGGMGLKW